MLINKLQAELKIKSKKLKNNTHLLVFAFLILVFSFGTSCRYDMQDQPRYKPYKDSDFFADGKAMRDLPEGTVSRGNLRENKALYTGKKDNADPNAMTESVTDPVTGNTLVSSFPNDIDEFPVPIDKELLDRGEQRYKVFCIYCHGPVGSGDGMVVRRGYPAPPTYHDDRLRNAPVGHFFDVITNGWGKMNSYASQVPVADRWAIVAYIRTLQISQNPNMKMDKSSVTSDKSAEESTESMDNKNKLDKVNEESKAVTGEPSLNQNANTSKGGNR